MSPSERTCDVVDCDYSLQNRDVVISNKVVNRGVELTVLNINDYSFYQNQSITNLVVSSNCSIGAYAFYDCDALFTVEIKNRGDINSKAFYHCDNLLTAIISNVGAINYEAFAQCKALNSVILGDSITSIGNRVFESCTSLPTITIPNNVTSIGDYLFYGCSKLATINIGTGIDAIPQYAFANCSSLNNVSIPNNVKNIGNYVFSGCRSLANLIFQDNELDAKDWSEAEIPVTQSFEDWTSSNNSSGSTSYKEYTMNVSPGDILSFNYSVNDYWDTNFLIIKLNWNQIVKESYNNSGSYTKIFTEAGYITLYLSYTKNYSYSSEQDKASVYNMTIKGTNYDLLLGSNESNPLFADCPLDDVYIGRKLLYNNDSSSGYSPFYRNTSLRSVEVTDAETEIYDNEFYGCTNLKTLKIGNGVKTIGKWAFSGCSSLDYFSAGYNVESIGEEAFSDCTGLTNYYSFSILPPVCGNQALDDINKWNCTLFVPAESSDEYMAADQWKDFFFVNETDAVLAESIRLNAESLEGKTGDTFQLTVEVLPENATKKNVEWSSSDTSVAAVDANGLVTYVKEGDATITARATDGSRVEASINVVVTVKDPELGDSNANGVVNIADAVNIANYSIGNEVEHFDEVASDVNKDGIISLADASATVSLILNQPASITSMLKARSYIGDAIEDADQLILGNFSAKPGEIATVLVNLDNTRGYTALQADVVVPEGMNFISVNCGGRAYGNHSIATRLIDSRTMRIVLFDLNNSLFDDNDDAILELIVKVNGIVNEPVKIMNIIASDAKAHEYALTSSGGINTETTGIEYISSDNIQIVSAAEGLTILNAEGMEVTIYTTEGVAMLRFAASSDVENCKLAPGIYIVHVGNKTEKVMVK